MHDPRKKELRRKKRQAKQRRGIAHQKPDPFTDLMPKRACGGCRACCTSFTVIDVTNRNEHCEHECEAGCAIYESRPKQCEGFECAWTVGWGGEDDRPDKRGWFVFSDPTYPQFVQLAGAGSTRKSLVRIQELRERTELEEPRLAQAIIEFVQARAAVLVSGEDDDGRWIALYGPRLPLGLVMTWEELERLAQGAAHK